MTYALRQRRLDMDSQEQIVDPSHDTCVNQGLMPAFETNNIPIVLMCSNYYVPYLSVFLQSMAQQISPDYNYDIVVLEKEISTEHKCRLRAQVEGYSNISLRFYNPQQELGNVELYIASEVYAEEAYYRLLTPWILTAYDKAIVMDCDIIVRVDLAMLYRHPTGDSLVLGVRDIIYQGFLNGAVPDAYEYAVQELGMHDPYSYINTGVLLMNLKKWRDEYTKEKILQAATAKHYRIQEQDVLNVLFDGKAGFLKVNWNFYVPANPQLICALDMAPDGSQKEYEIAKKDPYLVHYAGVPKPWNDPEVPYADMWWDAARATTFYETLLKRMILYYTQEPNRDRDPRSGARKLADKLLPVGSKRRGFAKCILPKDSLRWRFCKQIYYVFRPQYRPKNGE